MTGRLTDKRAVITGAAGGIGGAAARAYVAEGAFVGLLDRAGEALDRIAADLGGRAVALPADLTDERSIVDAVRRWSVAQSGLDVVYACAGVELFGSDSVAHQTSLDTWERTYAVNATGVFLTLKHTLPLLMASGGGSVIICGSPTGLTMSGAGQIAYSSSKAAAMALTRIVAADYAGHGIRANTIVPGTTATPLIADLLADDDRRAALEHAAPLQRIGTPRDLVGIAVFLASDESSYATGAQFAVDGGLTQR